MLRTKYTVINLQIDFATKADKEAVIGLRSEAELLTEDLPDRLPNFPLVKEYEKLIGVTGIEMFGQVVLQHSVAVNPAYQRKGIALLLGTSY